MVVDGRAGSKWSVAYEELKVEIMEGGYEKGDRFLTTEEVCERFNISNLTSRKVLDKLSRDNLIVRKPRIGSLIKNSIRRIYFFVPSFLQHVSSFTYSKMLKGVIEEAGEQGIDVEYIDEHMLKKKGEGHCIIVSYLWLFHWEDLLEGYDLVVLHAPEKLPGRHTIRHAIYEGAYKATEHLIDRGYKGIGFISGPLKDMPWYLPRFEGYFDALKDNGLAFDLSFVRETPTPNEEQEDRRAFEELLDLKDSPDAVFCANDRRALHVLDYCNDHGIRVPREIGVCGLDNIHETEISDPPLTTIDTHLERVGREGLRLAVKVEEGEVDTIQDKVIDPELIVRKTT